MKLEKTSKNVFFSWKVFWIIFLISLFSGGMNIGVIYFFMFWGLCGFILTFLFTSAKPKRKEDLYTSEDIINQKHTEKTDTPSLLNVLKDVWTILLSIICFLVFFYLGYLVMDMRHTIDKPGSFSGIMLIFFPIIPFFIAARYLPFIILGVLVLTLYDIVVCIRSKTFTKRLICKIGFLLGCLF